MLALGDVRSTQGVTERAFEVDVDGRWTEFWALADNQRAVDEFWS